MTQFSTVREAKEYFINRILAQADRDGVPLSDVERKMLYFSETGWTLPNMMDLSREFDESYDQDEYEKKIGQIIRRMREQPDDDQNSWNQAVRRLREEDHYLLVLIDGVSRKSDKFSWGDKVRLVLAALVVVAVFLPFSFFVYSHVENQVISKLIIEGSLLVLVVGVSVVAARGIGTRTKPR